MRGAGVVYILSKTEPIVTKGSSGDISELKIDPITGTEHGDTIGFIDLREICGVT